MGRWEGENPIYLHAVFSQDLSPNFFPILKALGFNRAFPKAFSRERYINEFLVSEKSHRQETCFFFFFIPVTEDKTSFKVTPHIQN